jgi:hypothetical protein
VFFDTLTRQIEFHALREKREKREKVPMQMRETMVISGWKYLFEVTFLLFWDRSVSLDAHGVESTAVPQLDHSAHTPLYRDK